MVLNSVKESIQSANTSLAAGEILNQAAEKASLEAAVKVLKLYSNNFEARRVEFFIAQRIVEDERD